MESIVTYIGVSLKNEYNENIKIVSYIYRKYTYLHFYKLFTFNYYIWDIHHREFNFKFLIHEKAYLFF